jgi:hypothetical protein
MVTSQTAVEQLLQETAQTCSFLAVVDVEGMRVWDSNEAGGEANP